MTIPAQVDELLAQMTPAEKAGQLTQYSYFGLPEGTEQVEGSRLGIPLLIGFDVIHGLRTIFPARWQRPGTTDHRHLDRHRLHRVPDHRCRNYQDLIAPGRLLWSTPPLTAPTVESSLKLLNTS